MMNGEGEIKSVVLIAKIIPKSAGNQLRLHLPLFCWSKSIFT